jgi:hypothetical protein
MLLTANSGELEHYQRPLTRHCGAVFTLFLPNTLIHNIHFKPSRIMEQATGTEAWRKSEVVGN